MAARIRLSYDSKMATSWHRYSSRKDRRTEWEAILTRLKHEGGFARVPEFQIVFRRLLGRLSYTVALPLRRPAGRRLPRPDRPRWLGPPDRQSNPLGIVDPLLKPPAATHGVGGPRWPRHLRRRHPTFLAYLLFGQWRTHGGKVATFGLGKYIVEPIHRLDRLVVRGPRPRLELIEGGPQLFLPLGLNNNKPKLTVVSSGGPKTPPPPLRMTKPGADKPLKLRPDQIEMPLFRVGEIIIGSPGVSVSAELIEACCERGIRISFLTRRGQPFAMLSSPMLGATVAIRREQIAAYNDRRGVELSKPRHSRL
jgi:CRISPR associated protein Cas1